MAKRKRDYRAEYKRRIARGKKRGYSKSVARGHATKREVGIEQAKLLGVKPGANLRRIIEKDRKKVFGKGRKARRKKGDRTSAEYQLRLEELAKGDGTFDWTTEAAFIEQMQAFGLSEHEAYSTWYGSPPI